MVSTAEKTNTGYITQIIGPVIDAKFPTGKMPSIYNALKLPLKTRREKTSPSPAKSNNSSVITKFAPSP